MTRYFKHPDSDQVEEVDAFQVLAVLFLGPLYLLFAGLWRHLLIWGAALGLGLLAGPPWAAIPIAVLPIIYCFLIRKIVAGEYLKKGWVEVPDPALALKKPAPDAASVTE
ncbi:hypothetical protein BLL37_15135 [Pseudomonas azotoformans]|jgi:hypothetical protein|uniref:DUF2628 domain-containing protein n=2 Tax=Pseudomonas TaxID=286 RepID=A0A1V2JHC9_PSEAZ|nr:MULTISPECIES: hypothetical protein [Pseudomonas]KTB54783.1 hypothetical protein AO066_14480 [Pseudomonas fluorescens]MDR9875341.1 hypothetical protein [Pseudomonas allii]NWN47491.1 hypothetical protein [Pseudomonas allii]OIN46203.1 hypothetical protein BFL39_21090 [Pseudomonas azotoformans]ONH44659.1 hypothetical protein BLL37_15135 [Pseudomonas azotoformans]